MSEPLRQRLRLGLPLLAAMELHRFDLRWPEGAAEPVPECSCA
ncbi:hypothetical protein [Ideonella sp.]